MEHKFITEYNIIANYLAQHETKLNKLNNFKHRTYEIHKKNMENIKIIQKELEKLQKKYLMEFLVQN